MSVFERIRAACAEVARRARSVRIEPDALARLAAQLEREPPPPPDLDPAHHHLGDDAATLAYVVCLDAVNFGSGWFPVLDKEPGLSGYRTVATRLKRHFEAAGPLDARRLEELDDAACIALFGQQQAPEAHELMQLFRRAWNDLGRLLRERYDGRFEALVGAAQGRAADLVERLTAMPLYRDVSRYDGLEVPLYKRAQLTAADLAAAFGGRGSGRFDDLAELTIFADNLVPHVLRRLGVLDYAPELARRIDAGTLLEAGSPEEVEIRAVALHAVERLAERLRAAGHPATPHQLDFWLWNHGQSPEIKAHPRHRARCVYY